MKEEKKEAIQKMKAIQRFSDAEIMDFLNLEESIFNQYIKELNTRQTKEDNN